MVMWPSEDCDLNNRDPAPLNAHLKCTHPEVLGEPDGIASIDCVWNLSYKCFELWKNLCYIICTTLCGIFIAMCWGCEFAYIAFAHIWFITPCYKVLDLNCGTCQKFYAVFVHCFCDPLCEACSHCFDAFRK